MAGAGNNADLSALKAVGKIDKASGSVQVTHPDGTHGVLHPGDIVYKGDVISTSGDGAVGITFADASTFSLGKSGKMTIDELVYDPGAQSGQSALSVVKGAFSFASGQIAKTAPDATVIKTPVMTIGIRGTTVAGQADDQGGANSVTLLADHDGGVGQVIVVNSAGSQVLSSSLQQLALFSAFQPPPPPVYVSPVSVQSMYGSAIDNRPPPPPPGTAPQQIVPNFQPSVPAPPAGGPGPGPAQVPTQPQNTPQPDQHGSTTNTDHPIVGLQSPPVDVTSTKTTTTTTTVLEQLREVQKVAAQNANDAGAPVPVEQAGVSGVVAVDKTLDKVLEDVQKDLTKGADKTATEITNTASQNNNQGQAGTVGGVNNSNDDAIRPNNGSTDNNGNQNTPPSPNGRAIDGYVANATVFRDLNNNNQWDTGEDKTTTDGSGNYYLSGSGGVIVIKDGTDTTTNKPLTFVMKAPAGSSVVTPLTTMVVAIAGPNADADAIAAAETLVKVRLGLPSDAPLSSLDPVASLGQSDNANALMAAIAKIVSTVNTVSALTGGGISADDLMSFLATKITNGHNLGDELTSSSGLNSLLSAVPGLSTYLDSSKLALLTSSLASSNTSLDDEILSASSYSAVSGKISTATSPEGTLVAVMQNIVQNNLDIHNTGVVFGDGATPGILPQLRAAGITILTFNSGANKTITAETAAGLQVTLNTVEIRVRDTGDNLSQNVDKLYSGFTGYTVTSGAFHLNPAELANLHTFLGKEAGAQIICDLGGGDSLTPVAHSAFTAMMAAIDGVQVESGAEADIDAETLLALVADSKITLPTDAKLTAVADGTDLDFSGQTFPAGVIALHVAANSTVTLDANQWEYFSDTGHSLTVDAGGGLELAATGDLTDLNLSKANHLLVTGGSAQLSLQQWDLLEGSTGISAENGASVTLLLDGTADLTEDHSKLKDAVSGGLVSQITVGDDATVTFDAATLLQWVQANKITLDADADITVKGDVSGFDASFVSTYFDHVVNSAPPSVDPAGYYRVDATGAPLTLDVGDLDPESLTYQITGTPQTGGTLINLGHGQFSYLPPNGQDHSLDTFTVSFSDGTHTYEQEIVVVASNATGSAPIYPHLGDYISAPTPGAWVDAGFSVSGEGRGSDITVVVYLGTEADSINGTLRVGDKVGSLWGMTGTFEQINAQLEMLQYQAPKSVSQDGSDYIHVLLYDDRTGQVKEVGFSAIYKAPDTFNGHNGNAWEDDDNWSVGIPDGNRAALIDGDKIDGSEDKVVVNDSNMQANGLLVVNGATLEVRGSLAANGTTAIDETSHLLLTGTGEFVNQGYLNLSGDVTVSAGAHLVNAGTIEIGGEADGASDGSGEGIATVTVVGDVDLGPANSTIVFEVTENGNGPEHDQLIFANGTTDLQGKIEVNVDPLSHYSSSEITLISGIKSNTATFGISNNSNGHAVVALRYDSGKHELLAKLETFGDGSTATFSTSAGTDFVFGAKGLHNIFGDPSHGNFIEGADQVTGGNLEDRFYVGAADSWHVDGGAGTDTLVLAAGSSNSISEYDISAVSAIQVSDIEVFEMAGSYTRLTLDQYNPATITGISYQDSVYAGSENDTFVVDSDNFYTVSGGEGFDTLSIQLGSSQTFDLTHASISSVEAIDLALNDGASLTLKLAADKIATMAPSGLDLTFADAVWDAGVDRDILCSASVGINRANLEIGTHENYLTAVKYSSDSGTIGIYSECMSESSISYTAHDGYTDIIVGARNTGNDISNIGSGDEVVGGAQADTFTIVAADFKGISGGDGADTLNINVAGTVDLISREIYGIEKIDLSSNNGSVVLDTDRVGSLSASAPLTIMGGANNTVYLAGAWDAGTPNGDGYTTYTDNASHTVLVQSTVEVVIGN